MNRRTFAGMLAATIACSIGLAAIARAEEPAEKFQGTVPPLIRQMVGAWNVQQRMWPGAGANPMDLAPGIARRRLMAGGFLEEVMQPAKGAGKDSFVRVAYFGYNAVNRQYEYFSLDSRAPQMMNERSEKMEASANAPELKLDGSTFVAPRWGDAVNMTFKYRLVMSEIQNNRQTARLYFTPQDGPNQQEFLAFEYVYTRRR